ncbi:scavenger receptor class F member 1-like [Haliotis asinina]|uniref:scavenger receptor class F member 1-like n=1 Tax=Haliotis asinina TaxID=109174 RepID=UPI0035322561
MWRIVSLVLFIAFMVLLVFYVRSTVNCGETCLRCDHYVCSKCVNGWYGTDCTKKCQGCEDTCDKQTGRCKECQPAHFSDKCDKRCPVNCRVSFDGFRHCDRDSGGCLDGCVPGQWGHQCQKPCTSNCDQSACHQDTGTCLHGCTDGWFGRMCDEKCSYNCRISLDSNRHCDRHTGRCLEGCVPGRWGHQCQKPCTGNCDQSACHQDTGTCLHGCTDGWFGQLCDKSCPENCLWNRCSLVQGYCGHCKAGRTGPKCDISCRNCVDNTCTYNDLLSSVNCTRGCVRGWMGEDCLSPCTHRCLNVECNIDGTCKKCPDGYYGDSCTVPCASSCLRCEQTSGLCTWNVTPTKSTIMLSSGSLTVYLSKWVWIWMSATICSGLY